MVIYYKMKEMMDKINKPQPLLLRIAIVLGFMGLFTFCAAGYSELVGYAHWFDDLRGAGCGLTLAFVVVRLFASSKWLRDHTFAERLATRPRSIIDLTPRDVDDWNKDVQRLRSGGVRFVDRE